MTGGLGTSGPLPISCRSATRSGIEALDVRQADRVDARHVGAAGSKVTQALDVGPGPDHLSRPPAAGALVRARGEEADPARQAVGAVGDGDRAGVDQLGERPLVAPDEHAAIPMPTRAGDGEREGTDDLDGVAQEHGDRPSARLPDDAVRVRPRGMDIVGPTQRGRRPRRRSVDRCPQRLPTPDGSARTGTSRGTRTTDRRETAPVSGALVVPAALAARSSTLVFGVTVTRSPRARGRSSSRARSGAVAGAGRSHGASPLHWYGVAVS